jgi:hypothetical protein
MPAFQPGLTFAASPEAVRIVRERLDRAGITISESGARSLVEAILAAEGPRMHAVARGILHGALETIRQTSEVALEALKESRVETADLVGVARARDEPLGDEDPRPVFKRRGR